MSRDNWEKRFDDVVRETERNLAKVKGTLQQSPTKYSSTKYNISANIHNADVKNARSPLLEVKQESHFNSTPKSYQHQIWRQDDEITKLRKQISLLEQSNIHYEQETKLLKSQVVQLKSKLSVTPKPCVGGAASNHDISRQFELFKKELYREIKEMKVQMGGSPESELCCVRKDVDNNRNKVAEELQETRNEMEILRNRLMKVEVEVKSVMTESKETGRRCQRLSNDMGHLCESTRLQNRATASQLHSLNEGAAHFSIIRSSVSDMQGRLSSLESSNFGSKISNFRNESSTPCSGKGSTHGSSYHGYLEKDRPVYKDIDLSVSLDDLSMLSEDEITLDNTASTYKHRHKHDKSITDTISLAGDLISDISGVLSDGSDEIEGTEGDISN